MDCSRCGAPINLDLMRCEACGHDMLPQDISRGPFNSGVRTANSEKPSADAIVAVQLDLELLDVAPGSSEDRADRARRMRRDYWRLAVFLAVMIGVELILRLF